MSKIRSIFLLGWRNFKSVNMWENLPHVNLCTKILGSFWPRLFRLCAELIGSNNIGATTIRRTWAAVISRGGGSNFIHGGVWEWVIFATRYLLWNLYIQTRKIQRSSRFNWYIYKSLLQLQHFISYVLPVLFSKTDFLNFPPKSCAWQLATRKKDKATLPAVRLRTNRRPSSIMGPTTTASPFSLQILIASFRFSFSEETLL